MECNIFTRLKSGGICVMNINIKAIQFTGLLYILLLVVLLGIFPPGAPGLPDGYVTPVIAFEFARTPEDVRAIFDITPADAREAYIEKMDRGNRLDFAFMVVYSLFLFLFSIKCYEAKGSKILLMGAFFSVSALAGDIIENIQLLGITENLAVGTFQGHLYLLHIFTWIKWMSICLVFAVLSLYFYSGTVFSKILSLFGVLALAAGIAAFFMGPVMKEVLAIVVGLDFFLLTAYSFVYRKGFPEGRVQAGS